MTNSSQPKAGSSAALAGRSALVFAITVLIIFLVRAGLGDHSRRNWRDVSREGLPLACTMGAIWFCLQFAFLSYRMSAVTPAVEILDQLPEVPAHDSPKFDGFVAMEYYCLMLNRTYVIFISSEGLFGSKANGPVSNADPAYFQPYVALLEDASLMHDSKAVHQLAGLPGGFFSPRSNIVSAEFVSRLKWGMGGIPHSGRIVVKLASGRSREFILLGPARGEKVRLKLLAGA